MRIYRPALLLALPLTLVACDSVDPGGGDGDPNVAPPAAVTHTLTLDWERVDVVGDCEGPFPASNTGDFRFNVTADSELDGETSSRVVLDGGFAVNTGGRVVSFDEGASTFALLEGQAGSVQVTFTASESDPTGSDPDLDPGRQTATHTFDGSRWSNLDDRSIALGSDSDCRVELKYEASSERS